MNSSATNQKIFNVPLAGNFTLISNKIFEHEYLSWESKSLLCYILSRPPEWSINVKQLASIYKGKKIGGGIDSIHEMLKELKNNGYVIYKKSKNKLGHWEHAYYVYPLPYNEFKIIFPERESPDVETPVINNNTEDIVVVVKEEPPPLIRNCLKHTSDGRGYRFSFEDLMNLVIQERKDWHREEIEKAWKILEKYQDPINNYFNFIEGIITQNRIKAANYILNKQKQNKEPTKIKTKEKTCQQDLENGKTSMKQSDKNNENFSENDTSEKPLAKAMRRFGLKT